MLDKLSALPALAQSQSKTAGAAKLKNAAQQFEALMIEQLLKTARPDEDSSSFMGAGSGDQTGQTAIDFAEQQLANTMAKNGGLGLTNVIVAGLSHKS